MPAIPDLHEPLTDGSVSLRLPAEWDIPEILIAHEGDPRLHVALGLERPPSGAELGREVENAAQERAAGRGLKLTITEAGHDDCQGRLSLHEINWTHRRAELGIWIAPGQRGRGHATRALRLALPWLFAETPLERLGLLTEADNAAMRAVARSAGFAEEGVLRHFVRDQGRGVDLVSLSRLRSDSA
jgi:RimJ/RimL family protein N-acetyltransferase